MPTLDQVSDFVYSNCDKVHFDGKGHFHCRCPVCGDSKKSRIKKRFHLQFDNENSIYWQCWNCGESGNFYDLYASIEGVTSEEAYRLYNKYSSKSILSRLNKQKFKKENKAENVNTNNFNHIIDDCLSTDSEPDGFIQNKFHSILMQFINDRKIDFPVYICYKGFYRGRIIIPIIENDNIIYFQGRRINEQMEPKYLNPSVKKQSIILNRNNFDPNKSIVVTEGIMDAHMVGPQGTSILGKELTQEFLDIISQYTNKDIIVVMDNDEDGLKKTHDYIEQFKNVKYFIMPRKFNNIKDLNQLAVKHNINKSEMYKLVCDNGYLPLKAKILLNKRS
jgi:5S rRNA maturation endonuclease (ribonuclease M5)